MSDKPEYTCPVCGAELETEEFKSFGTVYCPDCDSSRTRSFDISTGSEAKTKDILSRLNTRADLAKPSEWISVDDHLPEERECFIVWDSQYDTAFQAIFDIDSQEFISSFDKGKFKDACVTHWQPLPACPKAI